MHARFGRYVGMVAAAALVLSVGTSFAGTSTTATDGTDGSKAAPTKHTCKAGEGKCHHTKSHAKHKTSHASGQATQAPAQAQ